MLWPFQYFVLCHSCHCGKFIKVVAKEIPWWLSIIFGFLPKIGPYLLLSSHCVQATSQFLVQVVHQILVSQYRDKSLHHASRSFLSYQFGKGFNLYRYLQFIYFQNVLWVFPTPLMPVQCFFSHTALITR